MSKPLQFAIGFHTQLKKNTFFQWSIQKCQKTEKKDGWKFSHNSFLTLPFDGDIEQVQEASLEVAVCPLDDYRNDPNSGYEIYVIKGVSAENMRLVCRYAFRKYSEKTYGFLQIGWFLWRAFNNIIGRKIKGERNFFPAGIICSELVYDILASLRDMGYHRFNDVICSNEWRQNTSEPIDNYERVKKFPKIFVLAEMKDANGIHKFKV